MVVYNNLNQFQVKPSPWHSEPCHVGVDEAGRGPVLGPMVYAVAVAPISNAADLKKRSFADSKTLTAERRDELYDELDSDDTLCCFVDEIAPEFISGHMLAPEKTSLNTIAFDSTCKLINQCLAANINVQEVYVDTVGDAKTYQEKLSGKFTGIRFTVKPKADAIYPIVSAASIAAKVSRDRTIEKLGEGAGSGYPSDPKTKAWLAASMDPVFGFESSVRFSWGTADKILQKQALTVEWECEEDEDYNQISFEGKRKRMDKRHSYFNSRRLVKGRSMV